MNFYCIWWFTIRWPIWTYPSAPNACVPISSHNFLFFADFSWYSGEAHNSQKAWWTSVMDSKPGSMTYTWNSKIGKHDAQLVRNYKISKLSLTEAYWSMGKKVAQWSLRLLTCTPRAFIYAFVAWILKLEVISLHTPPKHDPHVLSHHHSHGNISTIANIRWLV
jgi:hypothetical protein